MTFKAWMQRQRDRRDAVGMLAAELGRLLGMPPRAAEGFEDWRAYLKAGGADEQTLAALAEAWREYDARPRPPPHTRP